VEEFEVPAGGGICPPIGDRSSCWYSKPSTFLDLPEAENISPKDALVLRDRGFNRVANDSGTTTLLGLNKHRQLLDLRIRQIWGRSEKVDANIP
jgi:hypothetical protein